MALAKLRQYTPMFDQTAYVNRIKDKMINATSDDTFDDVLQDVLNDSVFYDDNQAQEQINVEFDEGMQDFIHDINEERDAYGLKNVTADEVLDTATTANELSNYRTERQFGDLLDENDLDIDDKVTDKNKQAFLNSADLALVNNDLATITEPVIDVSQYVGDFSDLDIIHTFKDRLNDYDENATIDDMFNDLYNSDYYIIGRDNAENSMSINFGNGEFGALRDVVTRENDKYGENYVDNRFLTDPEKLANLVEYEKADDMLNDILTHASDLDRDSGLTDENKKQFKVAIDKQLYDMMPDTLKEFAESKQGEEIDEAKPGDALAGDTAPNNDPKTDVEKAVDKHQIVTSIYGDTLTKEEAFDTFGDFTIVLDDGVALDNLYDTATALSELQNAYVDGSQDAGKVFKTVIQNYGVTEKQADIILENNDDEATLLWNKACDKIDASSEHLNPEKVIDDSLDGVNKTIVFDDLDFDENNEIASDDPQIDTSVEPKLNFNGLSEQQGQQLSKF